MRIVMVPAREIFAMGRQFPGRRERLHGVGAHGEVRPSSDRWHSNSLAGRQSQISLNHQSSDDLLQAVNRIDPHCYLLDRRPSGSSEIRFSSFCDPVQIALTYVNPPTYSQVSRRQPMQR